MAGIAKGVPQEEEVLSGKGEQQEEHKGSHSSRRSKEQWPEIHFKIFE